MSIADDIKTGFYAGIGLMLKGKEKVEDVAREFIKDRNMDAEEGEKFVKDMVSKANETREEFGKYLDEKIQTTIDKMGYVKKEDYESIKKELEELKSSIKKEE